ALTTAPDSSLCVEAFDASRRVGLCSQSLEGISAIRNAAPQLPVDAESARAPGAGEKERLHVGTESPKEGGRLVDLVDPTHGDEKKPGTSADSRMQKEIQVGELDRDLAFLFGALAGARMLQLHLAVDEDLVGELVAHVGHGPKPIQAIARER